MRVQLDRGDMSVDLEESLGVYRSADRDTIFFNLLKSALLSLGYTELEMFAHFSGTKKEDKGK